MPVSDCHRISARLVFILYLEFALTGAVTTLLGPLLPGLAKRCSLSDADAGLLIAAQFAGNFAGALFANRNLGLSILTGLPLIALGVGGLAFSACSLNAIWAACYGIGLGLTISAINLIVARQDPSRRASSLTLLNFVWGAGAVGSPVLIGWAEKQHITSWVLVVIATGAITLWLVTIIEGNLSFLPALENHLPSTWYSPLLLFFAALLFLYIGVETSVGNWAAPYALRMRHTSNLIGASSVACFWLALLAGRLACVFLLKHTLEILVYGFSAVFTMGGLAFLLTAASGHQVLAGSLITGLGLAPMFPLLLSFASRSLLAYRNSGWVFSCAALGGAIVPWLTGRVSTSFHSLRVGLIVPTFAMILIITLSLGRSRGRPWIVSAAGVPPGSIRKV